MSPAKRPISSNRARRWITLPAALLALGLPSVAGATGMQGHMYMAQCAAEQAQDPRLRALFDAHSLHLENGAIFPDSGYTAKDHDQGEIAHWERYIEGYVEVLRERYGSPLDDPEGAAQVAFLMGAAAHGITDSTFDALFGARASEVEPTDIDTLDLAADIFLVHDLPRYYVPEPVFDSALLSMIYTEKIPHPVTPAAIDDAMSTARSGVAAVTKILHVGADDYGKKFPWSRAHLRDPRTPGAYPFGSRMALGYYREILRRLDGKSSADSVVIGTHPDAEHPLPTLDASRADGKLVFFFGEGLDRGSLGADTVIVRDSMGTLVPAKVEVFRGDDWPNVLTVQLAEPWKPATKYTATLGKSIKTLRGVSPSTDQVLSFTTCTPTAPGGDCAEPEGPPPPSLCPKLDARYVIPPSDEPEEPPPAEPPPASSPPVVASDEGCAVSAGASEQDRAASGAALALLIGAAGLGLRRRR